MPHRDDRVTAARPALIRALNWKTVVDLLRRMGPLSRADIVRLTGMSRPCRDSTPSRTSTRCVVSTKCVVRQRTSGVTVSHTMITVATTASPIQP